jgi:hypothetical protein
LWREEIRYLIGEEERGAEMKKKTKGIRIHERKKTLFLRKLKKTETKKININDGRGREKKRMKKRD